MKKSISVILSLLCVLSLFGCGGLWRKSEPVKPHLIEYSERELSPVRGISSRPAVAFRTNATDSLENQLDELFYIVYGGNRPEFSSAVKSEVKTVYDNALSILDRYIKNDFSDYEKVHAIHDYLTSQVTYDEEFYLRYAAGEEIDGGSSAFLLSGPLIDKSAVCDGFVKAFRFLCAVESIDTQEIRGQYVHNGAAINHVWAKVNVDGEWYNVDPTMDSITFYPNKGDPITVIHHGYFLISDDTLTGFKNHLPSDDGFPADKDYDFYSGETLFTDPDVPMQVNSAEELIAVFRRVKDSKRKTGQIEVRLDFSGGKSSFSDEIKAAYDVVKNKDFSYIPDRDDYTPFVRYPRNVYVFLIYK